MRTFGERRRKAGRPRKLPDAIVRQIRVDYANRQLTMGELAVKHNVHRDTIARILQGKVRVEAGGPVMKIVDRMARSGRRRKLSDEQVHSIRKLWLEGEVSAENIAEVFGISVTLMRNIAARRAYKEVR